jgi:predicted chitinase
MITLEQLLASPAAKLRAGAVFIKPPTKLWRWNINHTNASGSIPGGSCTSLGCWLPVEENLNYSAGFDGEHGLRRGFLLPSHCLAYERRPEKIANKVYANRMGSRDESVW